MGLRESERVCMRCRLNLVEVWNIGGQCRRLCSRRITFTALINLMERTPLARQAFLQG